MMRTSRPSLLIAILVGGLLAGSAVGVAGQDEETTSAASSFTGTVRWDGIISSGTPTMRGDGLAQTTGIVHMHRWEASDPRMTGDATYTGNWLEVSEDMYIQSAIYELTNDVGSWLGEATALNDDDTIVFTGRDAYEGLTAYVLVDWAPQLAELTGVIFPSAMPEVPEPHAAE